MCRTYQPLSSDIRTLFASSNADYYYLMKIPEINVCSIRDFLIRTTLIAHLGEL